MILIKCGMVLTKCGMVLTICGMVLTEVGRVVIEGGKIVSDVDRNVIDVNEMERLEIKLRGRQLPFKDINVREHVRTRGKRQILVQSKMKR